jgi:hypothetical protein
VVWVQPLDERRHLPDPGRQRAAALVAARLVDQVPGWAWGAAGSQLNR